MFCGNCCAHMLRTSVGLNWKLGVRGVKERERESEGERERERRSWRR